MHVYKVALIQNQTEMRHYKHADIRPLLQELGYEPHLYTGDNIDRLVYELENLKLDAVIFGSNALSDGKIRSEIQSSRFEKTFPQFLNKGKGCLILHQKKLAQLNLSIQFLPQNLSCVQPIARECAEIEYSRGHLASTRIKEKQPVWLSYPHDIDIAEIEQQCKEFNGLRFLYWHYWDLATSEAAKLGWDIHLFDDEPKTTKRPLIISSKESERFRVVLSSLMLDRQNQKNLLHNIITYVIEGRHHIALVKGNKTNKAFDYLIELLRSQEYQKYAFKLYVVKDDINQKLDVLKSLKYNIKKKIHTVIILDPLVDKELIENHTLDGTVKIGLRQIGKERHDMLLNIYFVGEQEKFVLRHLYDVEVNIQKELIENEEGYIDGSFLNTIESLQSLTKIHDILTQKDIKRRYDFKTLERTLLSAGDHAKDGSYDHTFEASCSLLWLRATYLGLDSEDTKKTLKWIREEIESSCDRGKVFAYSTLLDINAAEPNDIDKLKQFLHALNLKDSTDLDLIDYLNAAIQIKMKDVIKPMLLRFKNLEKEEQREEGCWVNLMTTATATIVFIDTLELLKEDSALYSEFRKCIEFIELMIYKSIKYMLALRDKPAKDVIYPWGNKASTSLRCIQALLKYERLIEYENLTILPISEIIKPLCYRRDTRISYSETALEVLEDLKKEKDNLKKENIKLKNFKETKTWPLRVYSIISFIFLILVYTLIFIIIIDYYKLSAILRIVADNFDTYLELGSLIALLGVFWLFASRIEQGVSRLSASLKSIFHTFLGSKK